MPQFKWDKVRREVVEVEPVVDVEPRTLMVEGYFDENHLTRFMKIILTKIINESRVEMGSGDGVTGSTAWQSLIREREDMRILTRGED